MGFQIVNGFDVFCPNKLFGCAWQGNLQKVPDHVKNGCKFSENSLPEWYAQYLKSREDFENE